MKHVLKGFPRLRLAKVEFVLGKRLSPLEISKSGLYALVKKKNEMTLRVTKFRELVWQWNNDYTYISEIEVTKVRLLTTEQ